MCLSFALRNKVILHIKVETCVSLELTRKKSNSQVNSSREQHIMHSLELYQKAKFLQEDTRSLYSVRTV